MTADFFVYLYIADREGDIVELMRRERLRATDGLVDPMVAMLGGFIGKKGDGELGDKGLC